LRISAVSSTGTVGITLFVVAESTVSTSNFATVPLTLNGRWSGRNADEFVESSIHTSLGNKQDAVIRMWSGRYEDRLFVEVRKRMDQGGVIELPWFNWTIEELTGLVFEHGAYLTRLEARLAPTDMVADITFKLDPAPIDFSPR
jgi:hypothetical protein